METLLSWTPVATLIAVAVGVWRGSAKFTRIEMTLERATAAAGKAEKTLADYGKRIAGIEGELRRVNGSRRDD